MNNLKRILLLSVGILVIPRLLRGATEEPVNFVDTPSQTSGNTIDIIPDFCPINQMEFASTNNFSLSEFHSKDGTLVPNSIRGNIQLLMNQLEVIRAAFQSRVIVNSGYRSPEHNTNVGGAEKSRHLCGQAADIIVEGFEPTFVQDTILQLMREGRIINGGLGRYNSFTHYDTGPSRVWDKRTLL